MTPEWSLLKEEARIGALRRSPDYTRFIHLERAQMASDKDRVRTFIRKNGFAKGDRIPPERELATILNLTRNQIRLELRRLEQQGEIWRQVGLGTFLGERPEALTENDVRSISRDLANPRDVLEARFMIEPIIAHLSAARASAADIEELKREHGKLRETREPTEFLKRDRTWHLLLARSSGNALMTTLLEAIHKHTDPSIWRRLASLEVMTNSRMDKVSDEHQKILDAVSDRDPEAAYKMMQTHVQGTIETISGAPPSMFAVRV